MFTTFTGCHLVNLIVPGIIWKSFGILFIPIQEHFLATATQLYFISSLLIGLGFLLGYYTIYIYIYIYIYLFIYLITHIIIADTNGPSRSHRIIHVINNFEGP